MENQSLCLISCIEDSHCIQTCVSYEYYIALLLLPAPVQSMALDTKSLSHVFLGEIGRQSPAHVEAGDVVPQ